MKAMGSANDRQMVMPTEEEIRRRAYELYLAREDGQGDPESDWLQAEAELKARIVSAVPVQHATNEADGHSQLRTRRTAAAPRRTARAKS